MRVVLTLILAVCLLAAPFEQARAQTSRTAPPGAEPIPGYSGLYVANANRFMFGAFVAIMLSKPRDVRAFLAKVKTCASSTELTARLRREGLNTSVVPLSDGFNALRTGACDVFVGTDFDFAQLDRRLDTDSGQPDTDRPNQGDDVDRGDDVYVDRTPPEIDPPRQVVEGQGRTVEVRARIVDPESGIRYAFIVLPEGGRVRMSAPQGSSRYSATVNLPSDFNDQIAAIVATNPAERSAEAQVTLRLIPWCGPRRAVGNALVKEVQENLACVGVSPGASDGALGPNTCRAIGAYLRDRMTRFNSGGISWTALRDELGRVCRAAQPVELDVPGTIELDAPRTNASISLRQPGATETITVSGPGIGAQSQVWRGQPVGFELPMPRPGQQATYQVQALGPQGNTLDRASLRLIRPPVRINVRPSGTVTVDQPRSEFTVTIPSGASAVSRIEARRPDAGAVGTPFGGGAAILSVLSPDPGTSLRVTFAALDGRGNPLAQQAVTLSRLEPVLPPRLSIESPAGSIVDASEVHLRVVLENGDAAHELLILGGPNSVELARRPVGDGFWDIAPAMPPPGQSIVFVAQAVDRAGKVLVEDRVRVQREAVRMQVRPTAQFEADTDSMTAQASLISGADWISAIIARAADGSRDGPVLSESAPTQGQARLQLEMPQPGATLPVEITAIGRDGKPYATERITLVRPAVLEPVALRVTSPDGFAIDANMTRLSVQIVNPPRTAMIVVSDPDRDQVLARGRYEGMDWLGQVEMPPPGQSQTLIVEAQDAEGETLATSQIMLLRPLAPGPIVPRWVWIGGLILAGIAIGYLGARLGGGGRDKPPGNPNVPPPRPRVYAEPDRNPAVGLKPSSPPTLAIRIDVDLDPDIEIEFEKDKESQR